MILTSPAKDVVVVSFLQITQRRSSIVAMSVTPQVACKEINLRIARRSPASWYKCPFTTKRGHVQHIMLHHQVVNEDMWREGFLVMFYVWEETCHSASEDLRSTLKLGCRQFGQGLILRAPRPAIALGARSSGFWCCNCCTLNCCSQRSISSWSKKTHDVESLHAQQFNSGRKLLYREVELKGKEK